MKVKSLVLVFAALLLLVSAQQPAQAGVNVGVGVNVGLPAFTFQAPPAMVVIPGTYAYYVPDADVDIFFYQGHWYRSHNGQWYRGKAYNGPWVVRNPRYVPAFFLDLQPGWRQRIVVHERIPYDNFHRNWRNWEKQRYWEKKHDWWKKERNEWRRERRDDKREVREDRKERKEDRREAIEDRKERKEDLMEKREDRRERKEDKRERIEDREERKEDRKDLK